MAENIHSVDISLLHALSISVGWPHRSKDWELLLKAGRGIVAVDGIGRVFGSAMWFPHGDNFATIGAVITTPRSQAQGNGRWLMEQIFEKCGERNFSLNSTNAAYKLYLTLGFKKEAIGYQYVGEATPDLPPLAELNGKLEALPVDLVHQIERLDTQAFGVSRAALLSLLAESASISVLRRDGEVVGYSMCREFGRGHVIGPIVAANDQDATQLLAVHLRELAGRFVRVDTRSTGQFAEFLVQCGLTVCEKITTMSKGRPFLISKEGEPNVFGLAGHALG